MKRVVVAFALVLAACTASAEAEAEPDHAVVEQSHEVEAEHHDDEPIGPSELSTEPDDHGEGHEHEAEHQDEHDAAPVEGAHEIVIVLTEFAFTPGAIHMEAGELVTITLVNEGAVAHHFGLDGLDFHLDIEPGETVSGSLVIEEPGEYTIGCHIEGHQEAGMVGELHVEA